jgi:sugar fermentation stimulation protein A
VHDNPKRKLANTLEMIRVGRCWVGLHAARANAIAEAALVRSAYSPFAGYASVQREVTAPEGSRFDFRLSPGEESGEDRPPCWIEVKSVTLCEKGAARFPDAVTKRGKRHLEHLLARHEAGERAALLYIVQRGDADSVAPADAIDAAYGEMLRHVVGRGVEVHALGARVLPDSVRLERVLPVLLG